MIRLNDNFNNVKQNYLFSEVAAKLAAFQAQNPSAEIIRLGIGDVTLPLNKCVVDAMHTAVDEMSKKATFRGYPPEQGYDFLREAISRNYKNLGVDIKTSEIFVSDGAKSDMGNLPDIFSDNTVLIPDPVYPVYLDSNLMSGRKVEFLAATQENGFLPMPEGLNKNISYLIYLCSPNNPTGAIYSKEQLTEWVNFAIASASVIIFDAAYESFVVGDYPHSVYEIPGAESCAIEVCSFSKSAGFTGTRCAYTVIPGELTGLLEGKKTSISSLWLRRQATKFNGVSYIVQRGAEAALTEEGKRQTMENIDYYRYNAKLIASALEQKGIYYTGGICSPYIWLKCPNDMRSWEFFDYLLGKLNIVGTPGVGFGANGEGFFRLTAFGDRDATALAAQRIVEAF